MLMFWFSRTATEDGVLSMSSILGGTVNGKREMVNGGNVKEKVIKWSIELDWVICVHVCVLLTNHLQIANLANHRIGVHLAHVIATIILMCLIYVQQPRVVRVGNTVPWYTRYNMSMYGEYHLAIYVYPGDL